MRPQDGVMVSDHLQVSHPLREFIYAVNVVSVNSSFIQAAASAHE